MGEWKPLLPLKGSTLIETVVSTALKACARVILVTGYRGGELADIFRGERRVKIVQNPGWEDGMFSSIKAGVHEIDTPRFFIVPGDMPFLSLDIYRALMTAHTDARDKVPATEAVIPEYNGRRGHPVLVDGGVIGRVIGAGPATRSMREILAQVHCELMPWKDDTILKDIDTPTEYRREGEGALHEEM